MQHTEQCQRDHAKYVQWDEMFPNRCRRCNGGGLVSWSENQAPLGSGRYWPEEFSEPCRCIQDGRCPLCNFPLGYYRNDADGYLPDGHNTPVLGVCHHCGWIESYGHVPNFNPQPIEFECYCWEVEAEAEAELLEREEWGRDVRSLR